MTRGYQKTWPGISSLHNMAHMLGARLPLALKGVRLADLAALGESGDTLAQVRFALERGNGADPGRHGDAAHRAGPVRPAQPGGAGKGRRLMADHLGWNEDKKGAGNRQPGAALQGRGMTAFVVFNPNAAGGRTGREWREIEEALERVFPLMSFFVTAAPGQAARMVRDALRDGHMEIIAVGGDGTINEALNGFFEHGAPVSPQAVFSFVHSGSDSALCRKFGLLPGWPAGIEHLKQARVRKADVGRVSCLTREGAPASRYFLGAASFGLSGSIARAMGGARIARFFGPGFALSWHSMMALLRWRTCRVRLIADNYDEIAGIASVRLSLWGIVRCGDRRRRFAAPYPEHHESSRAASALDPGDGRPYLGHRWARCGGNGW